MIRVADYIIERVCNEGVQHIFMVTGWGVLYLSDAIAKHEGITGISMHHEQAAAFAAVAYAQYTAKTGACLVSMGCGGTNAMTGLLNAWQDGVPCVFVSGQNKLQETVRYSGTPIRTFGQQETDIIGIVQPLTKYAVMITDPQQIAYEMDKALYLANSGRKGPVWIDVPIDVQNMRVDPEEMKHFTSDDASDFMPSDQDVEYVVQELQNAIRPILLIGSGIRWGQATSELEQFVERFQIPVTFDTAAPDIYGASHPLSIGAVGSIGGTRAGNFALQNADFVLVLGCRLSPVTTGPDYDHFVRAGKVVVVDIEAVEHSKKTVKIDRLIISDVKKFLLSLLRRNVQGASPEWQKRCLHWKEVFPLCEERYKKSEKIDIHHMGACLSEALSDKAVLLTDAGLEELIIPSTVSFRGEQRCIHPVSQGSMGFALPASVGAYLASGHETVAVIGDGSIMMNLQELQTIAYNKLPIKILVVNNNVYAIIRKRQVDLFRSRTIGTDPANGVGSTNFQKVAECFGIEYVCIDKSADLRDHLEAVFNSDGPVLCEVMAVENQDYLRSSYEFNSKKRLVQKPLEDQAPFLERELFLAEMIIEPLD